MLEWENHAGPAPQAAGAVKDWSVLGPCKASLLSILPAPSSGAPGGIDFPSSLFGLLINCGCSSLGTTRQMKEIYGHCPTSPVSLVAKELSPRLCSISHRA